MNAERLYQRPALQAWMLILVLICILFFGLRPRDYNFSNNVAWLDGHSGLRFGKYGIAYTQPFDESLLRKVTTANGFSITLDIKPQADHTNGFGLILCIHDGDDGQQLIVGQWRSYIVAMNDDDYAHKRRVPRIVYNLSDQNSKRTVLTITTAKPGTRMYANGRPVKENRNLRLHVPAGDAVRLIVGNSVYGKHAWQGVLHGLVLHDHCLLQTNASLQFENLSKTKMLTSGEKSDALLFYRFDNGDAGSVVQDLGSSGMDLHIPKTAAYMSRTWLSSSFRNAELDRGFFMDTAINLVGFVPLGCLAMMILKTTFSRSTAQALLISVLAGFLLSLGIETIQAWLPSRSSSLLDLIMNTFGTFGGAMIGGRA